MTGIGIGLAMNSGRTGPPPAGYVALTGTSGEYIRTADKAQLDITGDITLGGYFASDDWTPAVKKALVAKRASGQFSYFLSSLISGAAPFIAVEWSADGSTGRLASADYSGRVTDSQGAWIAADLDVDNGAGSHLATFYISTDPPSTPVESVSWTTVGTAAASGGGTTSLHSGTAQLELGSISSGTGVLFVGKVYRGFVKNGLMAGGTLVADWSKGVGTDAHGNTWIEP